MTAGAEFSEVSKVPEVQESPFIEPPKGESRNNSCSARSDGRYVEVC